MCQLLFWLFGANQSIDRTALWTGAIAIVTILGIVFALLQLHNIRRTSRADFAKRFIDSFFTQDTRTLFTLLMNSALKFTVKEISENGKQLDRLPCFEIKQEVLAQLSGIVQIEPSKTGYSAFEIDDLLLGHFDDLGWYVKRGLIDYGTALQSFRYYLVGSFDSPPIQQYIQDEDNEGMYENVRYLYNMFRASPPPPHATASRWWRLRW
jgi:hypothetical protein